MTVIPLYRFTMSLVLSMLLLAANAQARSFPDFTDLIEEKSPAVVKITAQTKNRNAGQPQIELPDNVPEIFRHFFDPRQMPERESSAAGSGFFISDDGYVLTNNHVVEGATDIVVRLIDRREYEAEIVGTDPQSDLALLKIEEKNLPYLKLADSDKARVGEWVLAIGSPFGLDYSVTAGIISAIGRSIPADGRQNYVPFIQTDVAINPGNSGGPLFNLDGDVVGINSQIYTRSGGSIGLSFAIPSNLASDVVDQLKNNGKVNRGWLGVVIQEVDKDLALSFGLKRPRGALISQMEPGGPAERSGLKEGDIILEFNGRTISRSADLPYVVGPVRPGTVVPVEILRERKKRSIEVTVGSRANAGEVASNSEPEPIKPASTLLGLVVEDMTAEMKRSAGVSGVVITQISANSPAAAAGLEPGDILVQLGFEQVQSVKQFRKVEQSLPVNKPQPVKVVRRGSPIFRSITIEK